MNIGKAIVYWQLGQAPFYGDIKAILDDAEEMGATCVMPKVGDGIKPWYNLEEFCSQAHERGFLVVGWWYIYGQVGEGIYLGKQVKQLALDGAALDVEAHFDNSGGDLSAKAGRIISEYRAQVGDIPLGLCSWWKPSYHKTPIKAFLRGCDFNMPQCYQIKDDTSNAAVERIKTAIKEYGFAGPTIPMCAAFGEHGWTASVEQMNRANDYVLEQKLPGIAWYARHAFETGYKEAVAAHNWPKLSPTQPQDSPGATETEQGISNYEDGWNDCSDAIVAEIKSMRK